ncbi:uncharacterized protein PG998_014052 [Apiospora kogelbergensis]|uniref:uncharacterized protein n=1 Tax=Apiospora kogelbergensis TaxID=1337665 RepID=UPI00312FB222
MATPISANALGLDGGDSRAEPKDPVAFSHTERPVNIKSTTLEEYLHYASITRAEEKIANEKYRAAKSLVAWQAVVRDRFSRNPRVHGPQRQAYVANGSLEAEWKSASRAVRTAGWGSAFYLIATDVLGPSQTPWSFSQLGYGPGFALYTVFGLLSGYSGLILWELFLKLDSDRFPMRNYSDLFGIIFGPGVKHFVNIAQAIQLIAVLGFLILLNGQGISQMAYGPEGSYPGICFVACLIIFTVAGFGIGQIRTLQRYSGLANFAVFINLLVVLIVPLRLFLAEMRHPMDFWKSILCAQILIYVIYVVFGMVVYHYHGQYTYSPAVQGVSDYKWQTALNVMNLVMGLIACGLFGNIGVKIVYIEVFERLLHFPLLHTTRGRIWWAILSPAYWVLGFILAAAIPQFPLVSGLIGAIFGVGFTYVLPALAALGFRVRRDAMLEEIERFDPATGTVNHKDSGIRRHMRGFMKNPVLNVCHLVYFLGSLVICGLGCYAAISQLKGAFSSGVTTSFTCDSPV